jgi:hypothetical protein
MHTQKKKKKQEQSKKQKEINKREKKQQKIGTRAAVPTPPTRVSHSHSS